MLSSRETGQATEAMVRIQTGTITFPAPRAAMWGLWCEVKAPWMRDLDVA